MGIKNLNRFLKEHCKSSIQKIPLSELKGKRIVIDTSIYMYKFVTENALIENIYLMLSMFRNYEITPIFVFDGKPPADKLELLKQRKHDKIMAEQEYNKLLNQTTESSEYLNALKKRFVYITKKQIADVKTMIRAFNAKYIEAIGEADEVCAHMVHSGEAYAVMSEDMDMFVYGCDHVLRYTNLLNHTTVLYDVKGILVTLGITQTELREICILSGTDYNIKENELFLVLKQFKKYHKQPNQVGFCNWLRQIGEMTEYEYNTALDICSRFELQNIEYEIQDVELLEGGMDMVKKLMTCEGFLFPIRNRTSLRMVCL